MPPTSIADLLRELGSKEPQEAWVEFLNDYSSLVYQVIRRFEADIDNAADFWFMNAAFRWMKL